MAVTEELTALAMPHARVSVVIDSTGDFGPMGVDEVELRMAPHPASRRCRSNKGASGGELSRVMLAIEVVFAGADPVPTFVFDEVDAGVGGKAAVEIGRRLAKLARTAQVIVVTHLPQVARLRRPAPGRREGQRRQRGPQRRGRPRPRGRGKRELARMLAGMEDSELGRAHAEELLATGAPPSKAAG